MYITNLYLLHKTMHGMGDLGPGLVMHTAALVDTTSYVDLLIFEK